MRKTKEMLKRALALLLMVLTIITSVNLMPEADVEASPYAPILVSPVELYNKSDVYGGYCYSSGSDDHYILLPTVEQVAKEVATFGGTVPGASFYLNSPEVRTGRTYTQTNYDRSNRKWKDPIEYVTQATLTGLDMTSIATLEWLDKTGNYGGVMTSFHRHSTSCYPAGAVQHRYHTGIDELSYIHTFDIANGTYSNGVDLYDFKAGKLYTSQGIDSIPVNNGCYTFSPTDSGIKAGVDYHVWEWYSDCGDNVTDITSCYSCGGTYSEPFTDVEYEEWKCLACGKTCTFKPIQRCGLCGVAWNGTGHGEQSSPSEVDMSYCGASNRYFKFSPNCGKLVGHWYVGDTEVEPICHYNEVVAVVPLVDMNETIYVEPGETPVLPCRIYYTTGEIVDTEVPIEIDPDSTELQTNTTIKVGQRHILQFYTYVTYSGSVWYSEDYTEMRYGYTIGYAAPLIKKTVSHVTYDEESGLPGSYVRYSGPSKLNFKTIGDSAGYTLCNKTATVSDWFPYEYRGGWGSTYNRDSFSRIEAEVRQKAASYTPLTGMTLRSVSLDGPSVLPGPPVQISSSQRVTVTLKNNTPGVATPSMVSSVAVDGNGKYQSGSRMTCESNAPLGYNVTWTLNGTVVATTNHYEFEIPRTDSVLEITYTPKNVKVTFDPNGGTCAVTDKTVTYTMPYGSLPTPIRSGYDFVGWQYASSGYVSSTTPVSATADHTLVAVWQEADLAALWLPYDDEYGTTGPLPVRQRPGYTFIIEPKTLAEGGYGWYFDEVYADFDGDGVAENLHRGNTGTQILASTINKWTLPSREIHARWEPNRYTVTFICKSTDDANAFMNSSVVINGADSTTVQYTTAAAKNFKGNAITSFKDKDGNALPGTWNSQKATKRVMYDMLYSTFPVPVCVDNTGKERSDVVFLGWSPTGKADDIVREIDTVQILSDITLYAVFEAPREVKITLDPNGGALTSAAWTSPTGIYHEFFNIPSAGLAQWKMMTNDVFDARVGNAYKPVWVNRKFLGWNTKRDGSGAYYTEGDRCPFIKDTTLYAQWEYYIYYNPNDQDKYGYTSLNSLLPFTGYMDREVFRNNDTTAHAVKECAYTREGCVFIGWNTERDGSGTWYYTTGSATRQIDLSNAAVVDRYLHSTTDTIKMPADGHSITLYAQWDDRLALHFDYRGGNVGGDTSGYTVTGTDWSNGALKGAMGVANSFDYEFYGRTLFGTAAVPVKEGYVFKGYYTDVRGAGEKVYDENGIYCYADTGLTLYNGSVALRQANAVASRTASAWSDLRNLYAYWELDSSLAGISNISFDLTLTNEQYDVNTPSTGLSEVGVPSTETVDVYGSIPQYVLATTNSLGDYSYFDLSAPIRIQYEDADENLLYVIIPAGSSPTRTVYVENLSDIYYFRVDKLIVRAYSADNEMCFEDDNTTVYEDTSGTPLPVVSSIEDLIFQSRIPIDTRVDAVPGVDDSLDLIDEIANGIYMAEYELVLSNYDRIFAVDPADFVAVYTPVAVDSAPVTDGVVAMPDGHDIVHDTTMMKEVIVIPSFRGRHISAKGYGLNDYAYSATGKLMLSKLMDMRDGNVYEGTVVAFTCDVWTDADGAGKDKISSDDIYYPAGETIPVGISGRKFYVASSVEIGPQMVATASMAVNIVDPAVFRMVNKQLRIADVSATTPVVNADISAGVTSDYDATTAYAGEGFKIKSSITAFDAYYTNLNYDDNVNTLDDYVIKKGVTLPGTAVHAPLDGGNAMLLKLGYNFSYRILSSGGFMGNNVKLKVVPKYELVDESFALVDADPKLYYMTYDSAGTKQYIVASTADTNVYGVRLDDSVLRVPTDVLNYSNNLNPLDYANICMTYNYAATEINNNGRLYNDVGTLDLPAGISEDVLRRSQQAWFGTFRVPGDLKVTKAASEFNTWTPEKQTSEVIYGYDDFVKDGYLKVTFTVEGYDDLYGIEPGWESVKYNPTFTVYYDLDAKIGDDYGVGGIVTH